MKKFFSEFKAFALKGNVLDLAVGVIIGGAFTGIVTSLTGETYTVQDIAGFASNFDAAVVNFIIMAFILFCLVKAINKMMTIGKKPEEAPAPTTKKCPYCCTDIAIEATRCPNCTSVLETAEEETAE